MEAVAMAARFGLMVQLADSCLAGMAERERLARRVRAQRRRHRRSGASAQAAPAAIAGT